MRYEKPHLSIEQQVDLLRARGMVGDPDFMAGCLRQANYHRLAAYWHPYRDLDHRFKAGTRFEHIWRLYVFDRRLRLLILDALERFEVGLRTAFALHHSRLYGPFGYAEQPESLPKMGEGEHRLFLQKLRRQLINQSKDPYFAHFLDKYGDEHELPPIWSAVELMDFGQMMRLYQTSPRQVKKGMAEPLGIPTEVLGSWIVSLLATRNLCAHHARVWNRVLGVRPKELPAERFPEWHTPRKVDMSRIHGTLSICAHLIRKLAPHSAWENRLKELLEAFPDIPRTWMGFPTD